MASAFAQLLSQVRGCTLCADALAQGVRPVLQADPRARILVAGQAPGSKVHASGVPFDDPSGVRLRAWMGVTSEIFYNPSTIALVPMGFCYPGRGRSGDLPPRPICAETWRARLLAAMPDIKLTLAIGQYAQAWHVPEPAGNLTETVRQWRRCGDAVIPLPHPSPRNNLWLRKNPWFEAEVVPVVQARVRALLNG